MKKFISFLCLLIAVVFITESGITVLAIENEKELYIVYDGFEVICELTDVEVGDEYLSYDFKLYRIIDVDKENHIAQATFVEQIKKPKITRSQEPSNIGAVIKNIGLYMTHNDESYVPTDGTSSVYGAGGIHDVAKSFKASLVNRGINVIMDETLHIPHDSYAYSRSAVTAKALLAKHNLNAIFDVHRDGVSRSFYVTKYKGEEKCHVRMVVGKASSNYSTTFEFAKCLMTVGQELYPWLFSDIFIAQGHYNQALSGKAMLFEMGTYLVEKELVKASMPALANVIDVALFGTVIDTETGELTINGNQTETTTTIDEFFEQTENTADSGGGFWRVAGIMILSFAIFGMAVFLVFNVRRNFGYKK